MHGACSVFRAKKWTGPRERPPHGDPPPSASEAWGAKRSAEPRGTVGPSRLDWARGVQPRRRVRPKPDRRNGRAGRRSVQRSKEETAGRRPTELGLGRDVPAAHAVGNPAGGIFRGAEMPRGGASRNLLTAHAVANSGEPPKKRRPPSGINIPSRQWCGQENSRRVERPRLALVR